MLVPTSQGTLRVHRGQLSPFSLRYVLVGIVKGVRGMMFLLCLFGHSGTGIVKSANTQGESLMTAAEVLTKSNNDRVSPIHPLDRLPGGPYLQSFRTQVASFVPCIRRE